MKKIFVLFFFLVLFTHQAYAKSEWDTSHVDYQGELNIKVFHNQRCNCCQRWIKHLKQHHFSITDIPTSNLADVNDRLHLPPKMKSSHTAIIEGYVIEGHVPADDIKRLLIEKPDILGLAVPKMPNGAPGAERGNLKQNFLVFQFDKQGKYRVFTRYQIDKNNHYQTQHIK